MEQTLGKRIVAHRKRLGLTQDQLAEQLGVTAQAVSKWENDQSCPDITMLPKLAEIFGITTDELLGLEKKNVHEAEVVTEETASEFEPEFSADGKHNLEFSANSGSDTWEFKLDNSRKGHIGMAAWVLLVGGLLLASHILRWDVGFWDILWPSGLLVFGLFGVLPKPSIFRIGCLVFGAYFLLSNLNFAPFALGKELLLPVFLLIFGLSLLVDAVHKPKKAKFQITHNGKNAHKSHCDVDGEKFICSTSFGENHRLIELPRLSSGSAEVSFGELTVDLSGCGEIADGCHIDLSCAFGELRLLVPKTCRVEPDTSTAFAAAETKGTPDPDAAATIYVDGNASFGEIEIKYV